MTGINISINSDEKDFIRGVKNSATSTEGLGDALADLDKIGARSLDGIEQDMRANQKATKNFTDAVRDGEDEIRKLSTTSRTQTRQVSDDFEETSRKGRESFRELGDEAKQNASETFSSFDGSAQSFVDGVQGTFGGIVSSLGPIGAAAGAAGAIGIGFISSAFQSAEDKAAELAQRTSDATDDMIASGRRQLSDQFLRQAISDQLEDDNLKKNQERSKQLGLPLATVAAAYAGVSDAQKIVLDRTDQYIGKNQQLIDSGDQLGFAGRKVFDGIKTDIEATIQSTNNASTAAGAYGAAIKDYGIAADDAAGKVKKAGDAVNSLPNLKTIKIVTDVDTSALAGKIAAATRNIVVPVGGVSLPNGKRIL